MSLHLKFSFFLVLFVSAAFPETQVEFVNDIEAIFKEKCYSCHGDKQQLGLLRLDSRNIVFQKGPSGHRIVPGEPAASSLYQRVAGLGEGQRMPLGGELSSPEIEVIQRWILQGANWPKGLGTKDGLKQHWAFVPPSKSSLPTPARSDWIKNPIDNFALARLEEEGLEPSPRASRQTLLRRLSLDIIGLPPTLEEAEKFLADKESGAYERLVERLLASQHYGERWGRSWLDAARYADSDGFEKDKPRQVWFYRDWVVNALNQDMPYDQFIIEQIAGDLLPEASQQQHVATGFLRNSMVNDEGGANPEQFRMEAMFDRMDAVGKAVLGLTVQCAQCHDHKFDPFTQRDYYRMFSFLNNSHEARQSVYTTEEAKLRNELLRGIHEIENGLRSKHPDWRERMHEWEQSIAHNQPEWSVLDAEIELGSGEKYLVLSDKSILAEGYAPTLSTVSPEVRVKSGTINAFRLELLTDPTLPLGGPGRSFLGTGALTEFGIEVASEAEPDSWKNLSIASATADINPKTSWLDPFLFPDKAQKRRLLGDVGFAIDTYLMSAWNLDAGPGRRNAPRKAVFQLSEPLVIEEPMRIKFNLVMMHGGWNSDDNQSLNLGRYRFSSTEAKHATADPLPADVRRIITHVHAEDRSPEEEQAVFSFWRTINPEWATANWQIEQLWGRHPEGSTQLVMSERKEPRMTQVLQRGDFLRPTEQVEPGIPSFLHPLQQTGQNPDRIDFAHWLVDRNSPTTARTIVNRLWQGYFGIGLVETAEDFGLQSTTPSHPELLDWLAVELMDNGWSLKHIHRLITISETYRQVSSISDELLQRDPKNRLLARGSRFRVDGEIVRDIALGASGLLNHDVGGPPVYPPAPEFLFLPPVSYGPKRWYTERGDQRYRRSLYAFRYRSVPYPVLDTFDTPTGNFSCVKRDRSNTPLQALVTLNETVFVEAARALGQKVLLEGGSGDPERINYAFRRVLTREPEKSESDELLTMLENQKHRFSEGNLDPRALAYGDGQPEDMNIDASPSELAAWTAVSRVLLNLDETITRE